MKISFVEPHLELYGGIRRILELANRLTKRGHGIRNYGMWKLKLERSEVEL